MELKGAQDSFAFLKGVGLAIPIFISDRHRSIAKWIREQVPETRHYFDIWHVAKSVTKELLKVGKESGCSLLVKWQKALKNHVHWCATSTKLGFGQLILAKWKSIIRHVCNKHTNHPDPLFKQCAHGPLSRRCWLEKGKILNRQPRINVNIVHSRYLSIQVIHSYQYENIMYFQTLYLNLITEWFSDLRTPSSSCSTVIFLLGRTFSFCKVTQQH